MVMHLYSRNIKVSYIQPRLLANRPTKLLSLFQLVSGGSVGSSTVVGDLKTALNPLTFQMLYALHPEELREFATDSDNMHSGLVARNIV
jgi:hypothetical protein